MKHYNIPIFIPELACPHQCVFCDQVKISGVGKQPGNDEIVSEIESHLETIQADKSEVSVAFFGGSFTGLPMNEIESYLALLKPYIDQGRVDYIRISTRPDYISQEILELLKCYHVKAIELGAQSTDPVVLQRSGRGHSKDDIKNAAALIKSGGFELGLQMMTGLPGDDDVTALKTAREIVELGADTTRIYPTLVIKGTALEKMFRVNTYRPQSLEEAVKLSADLYLFFHENNVKVLRTGLHPSEGLLSGSDLIAGPFHPAFGEMVRTEVWRKILMEKLNLNAGTDIIEIRVAEKERNAATGYKKTNKIILEKYFRKVRITTYPALKGFDFHVDYR